MEIISHSKPVLTMPEMLCDRILHRQLNKDPILKHINKRNITAYIGKGGSGKTSLVTAFLQTKGKLKKVFWEIFLFMPATSRASIKDSVYDKLPENNIFEGISVENLETTYEILKDNSSNNKFTLLIFDDVQSQMKNPQIEKELLHIIANSRNLRTCVFMLCQNYIKIPPNIRQSITDFFLFNVGKKEYKKIYDENVDIDEKDFKQVIHYFNKQKEIEPHSFIYMHEKYKFFVNWDELVFE